MYLLLFAFIVIVSLAILRIYQKSVNAKCTSKRRLDGKTCIVTGGTTGMGLETAKELARRGAKVIIACPFLEEGYNARKEIIEETKNNNVVFKNLNLSSLRSTREFATDILKTEERLDVLINNAGIGVEDKLTEDGMNFTMQINYYGHFLLTILLLPLLIKSGSAKEKSRIVSVTSICHMCGRYEEGNMNKLHYWYYYQIYGNSKFCLILFSQELARRLRGGNVVTNTVDPGAVGTQIFNRNYGIIVGSLIRYFFSFFFKTANQGAQTAIYLAVDENAGNVTGEFYINCKLSRAKKSAYDAVSAKKLWEESIKLMGLEEELVKGIFNQSNLSM